MIEMVEQTANIGGEPVSVVTVEISQQSSSRNRMGPIRGPRLLPYRDGVAQRLSGLLGAGPVRSPLGGISRWRAAEAGERVTQIAADGPGCQRRLQLLEIQALGRSSPQQRFHGQGARRVERRGGDGSPVLESVAVEPVASGCHISPKPGDSSDSGTGRELKAATLVGIGRLSSTARQAAAARPHRRPFRLGGGRRADQGHLW